MNWKNLFLLMTGTALLLHAGCKSTGSEEETEPVPEQSDYSILVDTPDRVIDGASDAEEIVRAGLDSTGTDAVEEPELSTKPVNSSIFEPAVELKQSKDAIYKALFAEANEQALIKVNINFDAANLADVIPAFAGPLNLNYIIDSEVAGTVTMAVNSSMTSREVWTLFEQILTLANAYCELDGKVLHIRPLTKIAKESGFLKDGSNIEVRLVPLKHIAAASMVTQLAKFTGSENAVTALEQQNALLVVETGPNLERLLVLIAELDAKPKAGWSQLVLPCRNVSSDRIKEELLAVLPVLGFPAADGDNKEADPGAISIVSIPRIQVIAASAATPEALEELRKWVLQLDKGDTGEQERVFVYDVINADAGELLQALSAMFPVEGSVLKVSGGSEGAANTSSESATGRNADKKTDDKGNPVSDSGNLFDNTLYVFADAKNNRMLIRTTPRVYSMVKAILNRIDTIPDRILMQVLVVEIELSDSNEFGIEFSGKGSGGNTESIFGTNFDALSPGGENPQTGGRFYIYNPDNPDEKFGYIRAIAGRNKLKVLSSPQIIATSHSEAKISVGKQVPIVTSDITDTASSVIPDNTSLRRSYQYKDTGIILTVTPKTTKGGLIAMDVEQVISEAVDNTLKGIDSPIIKEDELKTSLSFRSGRTLIMGGLIKEKHNFTNSSIPVIADIPFLRSLVGNTSQSVERTEILVLITATIITEDSGLQAMIRRYRNAVDEIKKFEHKQFNAESGTEKE
ncbi:secretin N-terminal domain-containing protein [Victivallis sp. Marseille-Q1083]|uniref:secretin N-terminal domain-containing protein n=1 Tax=Victivallis sp. Marseille-Q1083 TaxID=2717288 RepID=UPI001C37B791|nr:secretin N-terminal domain-containing protein [Victivallis sp. Marseille-Q1083]